MTQADEARQIIGMIRTAYGGSIEERPTTQDGKPAYDLVLNFGEAGPRAAESERIMNDFNLRIHDFDIISCGGSVTEIKLRCRQ